MYFWILLWVLATQLFAIEGYNGKSIAITLPIPTGHISFKDQNFSVLSHPSDKTKGFALIPIDYYTASEDVNMTWKMRSKEENYIVNLLLATYPTETLTVDPSKVTPPIEMQERIDREAAEAKNIYATFTPIRYWSQPFVKPMDSFITSAYGSARTYNGTLKSYHGGVDFRARTPLPIIAANDGIVILAEDRYYAGGTIIIDHGEGLYSCYFHLSRYDVKVGDYVKRSQPIALSGATGRITGPHLHFGMMLHGVQTDPLYLIDQINILFQKEPNETLASY